MTPLWTARLDSPPPTEGACRRVGTSRAEPSLRTPKRKGAVAAYSVSSGGAAPRGAVWALQQLLGGWRAGEFATGAIPLQLNAGFVGDHRELYRGGGYVSVAGQAAGRAAFTDRVEEVARVLHHHVGAVFALLAGSVATRRDQHPFRIAHEDRSLLAVKEESVVRFRRVLLGAPQAMPPGDRATLELDVRDERVRCRDLSLVTIESTGGRHGFRRRFPQNEPSGVDQMNAPIVQVSVAGRFFEAPVAVPDLRTVRNQRAGSAPEVPVQRLRRWDRG